MKKMLLLCGALLVVSAAAAMAAPTLSLSYDKCVLDGGTKIKTSACTTTTGATTIILAMTPDVDYVQYQGVVADVQFGFNGPIPAWWVPGCNSARASIFSMGADNSIAGYCAADSYGGAAAGVAGFTSSAPFSAGTNGFYMELAAANDPTAGLPTLTAGAEVFMANLSVKNTGSTATGCTGCLTQACINFKSAGLDRLGFSTQTVLGTALNGASWVSWQGAAPLAACNAASPTHSSSWGAVKALYR
jgi:hypothetical protein